MKATFKLLTNDTEFGSNIQVYIVDKNSNNIANLGTISEVTNDTLSSSVSEGGDTYEEGDEDKEMTWEEENVEMNHNHNVAGSMSSIESEDSDYSSYTVTFKVLNPEAEVGEGDITIDPGRFTNGDYAFKLVNTDDDTSSFTGVADIQITKHSEGSEQDSDEIAYEPKIEILDAYLHSGNQFRTFDQLLRSVWNKKPLRDQLLGNLMANVPAEQDSWKKFSAAIKEEYSTMIYESELLVNDLISENSAENADTNNVLGIDESITLNLITDYEASVLDLSSDETQVMAGALNRVTTSPNYSSGVRTLSRTERQNLNLNLDAKIDITLGGRARYIVGERNFTLARFNVFNSKNSFRLGTINKTVARQPSSANQAKYQGYISENSNDPVVSNPYSRYRRY